MQYIKVIFSADSNYQIEVLGLSEDSEKYSFLEIDKLVRQELLKTYTHISGDLRITLFDIPVV
jgi:hypothetical protein